MKKTIIYMLLAVLLVSMPVMSACGNTAQKEESDGSWTAADNPAADLPEEVQKAFDKALETLTGSYNEVIPVAYIGRQIVSGTNHAVLCRVTYADEKTPAGFVVLAVYEDLEGNAGILSSE